MSKFNILIKRNAWKLAIVLTLSVAFACPAQGAIEAVIDLGHSNLLTMVKTPEGLWFGKYEITQRQWRSVMSGPNPVTRAVDEGADKPVTCVNADDVQTFLGRLNALESIREAGFSFRLPTADEWTTACLAGSRGRWPLGEDGREGSLETMAWYRKTQRSGRDLADPLRPVGAKAPNAYGLYDMLGNAEEMTSTTEIQQNPLLGTVKANVFCGGGVNFRPEPEAIQDSFVGPRNDGGQNFRDGGRTCRSLSGKYNQGGFRICSATGRAVSAGRSGGGKYPPPAAHRTPTEQVTRPPIAAQPSSSSSSGGSSRQTSSSIGTRTDEELMAIAQKKADEFAAEGDFEKANRIMEQAEQFIQKRHSGGGTDANISTASSDYSSTNSMRGPQRVEFHPARLPHRFPN